MISYSGVILDKQSRDLLFNKLKHFVPKDWEWVSHHMTICLGELDNQHKHDIGEEIDLRVTHFAQDDKICAVKVSGYNSKNTVPHITIALDRSRARPKDSNSLKNWNSLKQPFNIKGVIEEVENKQLKENINTDINKLCFYEDIVKQGGKIYQVGGAVRDKFLGKQSKDLDIVIQGIKDDNIIKILQKFGKVNLVGKSFGVIKFTENGSTEEIDIAIPRTEKKVGTGYQGFEINADHTLPIEKDLERRDFTINSIAVDHKGNLNDPFNGLTDLKNKIIRVTNPKAFQEDPLRMLRAVQFASRFKFKIEPQTMKLIKQNARTIKEISGERILIEFDKIVHKGDCAIGAKLLEETGLYKELFGSNLTEPYSSFKKVGTNGEFIYLLLRQYPDPDRLFKTKLKGDVDTEKEIRSLNLQKDMGSNEDENRYLCFQMVNIYPNVIHTKILPSKLFIIMKEFQSGLYPKSYKQLEINGDDLIRLGYKGTEIGKMLKDILFKIYSDQIENKKQEIMDYLNNK